MLTQLSRWDKMLTVNVPQTTDAFMFVGVVGNIQY